MSGMFLGESVDPANHTRSGKRIELDTAGFTTHGVIVGQTGSGKTGLGMVLIEEALRAGIPTLLIDPKGDLANLALTFPELRTEDFKPWVEGEDAATVAETWKNGLAGWGLTPADVAARRQAAGVTIYTPGSTAGVGLNLIGSLRAPAGSAGEDNAEDRLDEVGAIVGGLLGLMGIDSDPLSGREHILLTNLIDRSWATGTDLDLAVLVAQVQQPPMRKLGVLDVDAFYPAKDRTELAMKLNGLLASPAFATWNVGDSVDIQSLLHLPDGRPRAAVISLAHLGDEERQFAVAVILGRLLSWMRKQPGTSQLRALIYFDEVFGFVPPTAMPPAKKPILTLLKQARAFGVGLVLATQNPVDVDYKALSNATTWVIGRLQTERDRDRLLDGMRSAAGGVDIDQIAATISGLAKREFVLHRSGVTVPQVFTSRWSMAYLRGPLTREQIRELAKAGLVEPGTSSSSPPRPAGGLDTSPSTTPTPSQNPAQTSSGTPISAETAGAASATISDNQSATSGRVTGALADNEVPIAPKVADGTPTYYLDPAAPWANLVHASPGARRHRAAVVARVRCLFDDVKLGIHETEEWEAVYSPVPRMFDPAQAIHVDYDPRDFLPTSPTNITYELPEAPFAEPAWFRAVGKLISEYLVSTHTLPIFRNEGLKLWSRIGEFEADFLNRCDIVAQTKADEDAADLRIKLMAKIDKLNTTIDDANRTVEEVKANAKSNRRTELLAGAGDLLGALFGGRRNARSIARSVGSAAARHGRSDVASEKLETAEQRVAAKLEELTALETQLHDELFAIDARWDLVGRAITLVPLSLERSDITVTELAVVWIPTSN
jgi:Helicase HerA, central domain